MGQLTLHYYISQSSVVGWKNDGSLIPLPERGLNKIIKVSVNYNDWVILFSDGTAYSEFLIPPDIQGRIIGISMAYYSLIFY